MADQIYALGNLFWYNFYKEASFGVRPVSASVAPYQIAEKVDFKYLPNIVDRNVKSGKLTDIKCNTIFASAQSAVSINANIPIDNDSSWFYGMLTSYMMQPTIGTETTFGTSSVSFTGYELHVNNLTKARYATGLTVKSININAVPGETLTTTVELIGANLTDWAARPTMTGSYAYTTMSACPQVCKAGDWNASLDDIQISGLASLTLNLDSEIVQNAVRYGNSFNPITNASTKKMITATLQVYADPTVAPLFLNADIATTIKSFDVAIGDISFSMYAICTNIDKPDPQAGISKYTYQLKIVPLTLTGNALTISI